MIIEVMPRADLQIRAARRWWLKNRDKAPVAFDEELDRAYDLMSHAPNAARSVRTRHGKARRLTIERIRYYLYYRVHPDRIEVISLWHTSRHPPKL